VYINSSLILVKSTNRVLGCGNLWKTLALGSRDC
jgi:hypothetical protein